MALTFDTTILNKNRRGAKLEIVTGDPTAATPVYTFVPGRTALQGFKPETQVTRVKVFKDAAGKEKEAVVVSYSGGTMPFTIISPPTNSTFQALLGKAGFTPTPDTYGGQTLAKYTDGNGLLWTLQVLVTYQGEEGTDTEGMTMYGFTLEVMSWEATLPAVI